MSVGTLWGTLKEQLIPAFAEYRRRIESLPVELKSDRTLLTEADVVLQDLIVSAIRAEDPEAVIIAEEDDHSRPRSEVAASDGRIWVIDPIDGTSQFVRRESVEFCSVVCLLENWAPAEAFILAPELGVGRAPMLVTASAQPGSVLLDGTKIGTSMAVDDARWLSITGEADDSAPRRAAAAAESEYCTKIRTTSQTLDLVRTALDISLFTEPALPQFSLFWRRHQKLWDGAAGLCLAAAAELRTCDEHGGPLPRGPQFLSQPVPTFPSTIVGQPEVVTYFLDLLGR